MLFVDKSSAADFLRSTIPEWAWLIAKVESEDGHLRFPPVVSRAIENLKIESYPLLYENEASIGLIMFRAFMSPEEMIELNAQLAEQTPDERGQKLRELLEGVSEVDQAFEFPKTPAAERRALDEFNALSKEDQAEAIKIAQHLWMGFLAGFFQNVSVMVHGEKLTSLVVQAKAGNDEAFCKAVQIDKRILTTIPHFRQRFERATLEGDQNFADALAYRLQCPPYKGKIRHKALWMAFAFLDMVGLLDTLKHQEILDLCDEAGIGGYANRIEDVKHLSKRLADFRRFRGYGLTLSTP
ncbi:hypothetical protein [Rhodoferax sp.]|uniref:hypothetical protein n=1 Tax=Rhodoferax sp. TaxID=50421 RepID=UPI00271E2D40|nr:hypothetical protein [Rhodoferax sp.]MDO8318699.1 hypothetical protein [Rhodoferax sp.]